ncbi:MAG: glycosyltransferase [Candidatus Diapherotrites archaeon]|uniref:Glycosyltransferase n=1 Tax=Candidatus Iainarchaeum sp. TaxID=3101447 RepID=A0A938YV56_9ARCH|nr:glycosyltransferase [Candidatus Diapherotrites archaeon]
MEKIRVLFNTSRHAFQNKGGGEVLLLKSKQHLEKEGVQGEIFQAGKGRFKGFDLFHNFSIHRSCFQQIRAAKEAGIPVALSPVYWPSLRYSLLWNKGLGKKAKAVAVELINMLDFLSLSKVRKMFQMSDAVLASSRAVAEIYRKRFNVPSEKISIVYNGVDKRFKSAKPAPFQSKHGLKGFVLYVGRVEPRKNVLSLVRAMKGVDEKLVVIGGAKSGSEAYFEQCKREAGKNVFFLGKIDHESEMLASAYAACKVFALPSWYETPGLAALEAGLAGANVAITREGSTREYFSNKAAYVNPNSVEDIREKVKQQLEKPKSSDLAAHIEKNFLWENTATQTRKAYGKILRGKHAAEMAGNGKHAAKAAALKGGIKR